MRLPMVANHPSALPSHSSRGLCSAWELARGEMQIWSQSSHGEARLSRTDTAICFGAVQPWAVWDEPRASHPSLLAHGGLMSGCQFAVDCRETGTYLACLGSLQHAVPYGMKRNECRHPVSLLLLPHELTLPTYLA